MPKRRKTKAEEYVSEEEEEEEMEDEEEENSSMFSEGEIEELLDNKEYKRSSNEELIHEGINRLSEMMKLLSNTIILLMQSN